MQSFLREMWEIEGSILDIWKGPKKKGASWVAEPDL